MTQKDGNESLLQTQQTWFDATVTLPPNQKNVLAHYINDNGKYRIVRAMYVQPQSMEMDWEYEYDETEADQSEDGVSYAKEGWYESAELSDIVYRIGETVTHWMNLPQPPSQELSTTTESVNCRSTHS